MFFLIAGIIAFVLLGVITFLEALFTNEFDPVCEQKCKNCICYSVCRNHGRKYECNDYMTEKMLIQKGLAKRGGKHYD